MLQTTIIQNIGKPQKGPAQWAKQYIVTKTLLIYHIKRPLSNIEKEIRNLLSNSHAKT